MWRVVVFPLQGLSWHLDIILVLIVTPRPQFAPTRLWPVMQ